MTLLGGARHPERRIEHGERLGRVEDVGLHEVDPIRLAAEGIHRAGEADPVQQFLLARVFQLLGRQVFQDDSVPSRSFRNAMDPIAGRDTNSDAFRSGTPLPAASLTTRSARLAGDAAKARAVAAPIAKQRDGEGPGGTGSSDPVPSMCAKAPRFEIVDDRNS